MARSGKWRVLDFVQAFHSTIPGCQVSGDSALYTEPEYKQHKLEVLTTESKDGSWGVEVTVSWQDDRVEQKMKYGPYQGFISPVDAQSWGIIRCINWIDAGKVEPSAFIPAPTQFEEDFPPACQVRKR
jgi:hypothetical protein